MHSNVCEFCGNEFPISSVQCSHCGQPGVFPNVRLAQVPPEPQALDRRYKAALDEAEGRGARTVVEDFERAVQTSKAVIGRPLRELDRLADSDRELLATYYRLLQAEVRLPHGNEWDGLRGIADEALFPGFKEHIRFAALSLDGSGLPHHGDCFLVLRESMIAHRASVYEENSTLSMKKHRYEPPAGYRATWAERGKLGVVKHGAEIEAATAPRQFAGLLLASGATPEEDRFIEVHIWGPISIRTVERALAFPPRKGQRSVLKALRDRLSKVGVPLEEIT